MVDCTTDIAVITAMMEATPATIPTSVRTDLSLFLTIAPKDMVKASRQTHGQDSCFEDSRVWHYS